MRVKITTSILLASFLLQGCGGGGGGGSTNSNTSNNTPNPIVTNRTANIEDTYYTQQWYLHKNSLFYSQNSIENSAHINPESIYDTYSGKGVKIAVIDDGIDVNHEDLSGAISRTYDLSTKGSNVAQNSNEVHGTQVSGVISARQNSKGIKGIADESELMFLKYKSNMSDSETIELFNKAQEFGADIINCSWGTNNVSPAVKNKIIDLANNGRDGKGIIIVFASGNTNSHMGNDESNIREVISVGATNKNNLLANYSNYGENLDIVAPGGESLGITTLDPSGSAGKSSNEDYILYNDSNKFIGTSASAPIVSGVIALMLQKKPSLTRIEVENILKNSADKIGNTPYVGGRNDYYGYGKINLYNAMTMVQ